MYFVICLFIQFVKSRTRQGGKFKVVAHFLDWQILDDFLKLLSQVARAALDDSHTTVLKLLKLLLSLYSYLKIEKNEINRPSWDNPFKQDFYDLTCPSEKELKNFE